MDAATKSVQFLSQRVLPELPHVLSFDTDWRSSPPTNESKKQYEEWKHPRLQYMTFVSEADRGVLLTRSYHDMRPERVESRPAHKDVNNLAKAGGEKKKMSLSDYKKKATGTPADTTPEPPSAKKREVDRGHEKVKPLPDTTGKPDGHRPREPHQAVNPRPPRPQDNVVDMRLPPKPPSLPPRPVSPESRKRTVDNDDDSRSQKRARQDPRAVPDERPRTSRDDALRRKERDSLDHRSARDGKLPTSASLPNGRSILKSSAATTRNPSPAGRARGDSLNGVRPNLAASTKNTPTKLDSSSRPSLPPLLSPLHINLDGRESSDREKKKAREDAVDGTRPTKSKKSEENPKPKRDKSPPSIPALLSPTLPQFLEDELARRGKPSIRVDRVRDDRDREDREERQASEEREKDERPPSRSKKGLPVHDDDQLNGKERPKSLLVTLRVPKKLRPAFKRLIKLPARKEPPHERTVSSEAQPGQAKKRPVSTTENIADTISVKRPRTSSISSSTRLPPPQTPSKRGTTAMSRVSSSNSQAHTPGDVTTATPSALGSSDKPILNGVDGPKVDKAEARALQEEKHDRFSSLGRKLKHKGDASKRAAQANGDTKGSDSGFKLGYVLSVESIVAFMTGFQALNLGRTLGGKVSDPTSWESLLPLLEFLQRDIRRLDMRRYLPLHTLILMLQAVTIDEVIKCYSTFGDPSSNVSMQDLIRHERNRTRILASVRDATANIKPEYLRPIITPWSSVDDISSAVLGILRHWCEDEDVEWSPEVIIKDSGPRAHN